jgi:hypothetical protein
VSRTRRFIVDAFSTGDAFSDCVDALTDRQERKLVVRWPYRSRTEQEAIDYRHFTATRRRVSHAR